MFVTVFALGVFELWVAVPTGSALSLHPLLNGLASGAGAMLGIFLVILLGERLRQRILSKRKRNGKSGRIYRIWDKYGVVGLGLLAPLLTGGPLGAAIGISFGANPKKLVIWMWVGVAIWTIILVTISTLGFAVFENIKL